MIVGIYICQLISLSMWLFTITLETTVQPQWKTEIKTKQEGEKKSFVRLNEA